MCKFFTSDHRHNDVGADKFYWQVGVFEQLNRLFAAVRFDDLVAVGLEELSSELAKSCFVFDDEDCLATSGDLFLIRFLASRFWSLERQGKVDSKRRAVSHFAVGHDVAVVLLHDAVHGGQPEPSSSPLGLRCE